MRFLSALVALSLTLALPVAASAQRACGGYSGGYCSSGYCSTPVATVVRSTYSPAAESRVIVREAPVVLKEDSLTQAFLNQQLLATAGVGANVFPAGQFGTATFQGVGQAGLLGQQALSPQGFGQTGLAQQGLAQQQGLQGQQLAQGQEQPAATQQEQLRQLQLQRQQLVQQQAQQMAAQPPQQAKAEAPQGDEYDSLKAEATSAAIAILRKEISDLKGQLSQPGVEPYQPNTPARPQTAPAMPQAQPQSRQRQKPAVGDVGRFASK